MLQIPASVRTLAETVRLTLAALLDAFVLALLPLVGRFGGGATHVAVPDETGFAVHTFQNGRAAPPLHIADGEPAPATVRTGALQLRLPTAHFLTRTLRLPDAGRGYLQPIIAHRLERLTPWRPDKVVYAFDPVDGVAEDGTIAVDLLATSVEIAAPYLARLEAMGLAPTALGSVAEPLGGPIRFNLYKDRPGARSGALRDRFARAVAVLFAVLVPACLVSTLLVWSGEAALQDAETRLATLRGRIGRSGLQATTREGGLIAAKRPETAMIVLIDRLSRALPDNTVLRELDIDAAKVRMVGRSGDAPALIARIEADANLRNPRFAAPVIRDAEKRDAFDLVAARPPVEAMR